jgi:3-methylcrotonyl-CoA carboxylase alpha subunit
MNTRLQVEHTVTEAVTGLDLVEWQLRVAAGEKLPLRQKDLVLRGHAIEARLYAEDPERDFLPQTGILHGLRFPPSEIARTDTGVRQGDRVTPDYDAMIAKIIAWGEDRPAAIARLQRALAETAILGLRTNLGFLARLLAEPDFNAGAVDTDFIERHRPVLLPPRQPAPELALAAAVLSRLVAHAAAARAAALRSADPYSPWARGDGWRLGEAAEQDLVFRDDAEERVVRATARGRDWLLRFGSREAFADGAPYPDGSFAVTIDGVRRRLIVLDHGPETAVFIDGESWQLVEIDPLAARQGEDPAGGRLTAPMPGRMTRLLVEDGSTVRRGQPLMVIEAMKMEHTIVAPADGTVGKVQFKVGDMVEEGVELITLAAEGEKP